MLTPDRAVDESSESTAATDLCAWASHTFCTEMNEICYPVRALWKVFAKYYIRVLGNLSFLPM